MPAAGYVSNIDAQVGAWYGATLTAEQGAQATLWQEAAEQRIDAATGQAWGGGAVTDEHHTPDGPYVYLRRAPLASATVTVTGYHRGSTTGALLTLTDQYEVDDLVRGRLFLPSWRTYRSGYLRISYTASTTVPSAISEATAALLADWLAAGGPGDSNAPVIREKVGDVDVQYATPTTTTATAAGSLPARVQQLLAPYLGALVFA